MKDRSMTATDHLAARIVEACDGERQVTVFLDGMAPVKPSAAALEAGTGCLTLTVAGDTLLVAVERLIGLSDAGEPTGRVGFALG